MRKLGDIEAEVRAERVNAEVWAEEHESALEPLVHDHDRVREQAMLDGQRSERLVRLVAADRDDGEGVYRVGDQWLPLISNDRRVDIASADISARVRHVMTFVPEAQAALLEAYYLERLPWYELRNGDEARQSVHKRIARARSAFLKAFIEHAEDDVELREEDF